MGTSFKYVEVLEIKYDNLTMYAEKSSYFTKALVKKCRQSVKGIPQPIPVACTKSRSILFNPLSQPFD